MAEIKAAAVATKPESLVQAEAAPVVEAPKAEEKVEAPAPAVVLAPSKSSDLIKKLKANAAAKLAKQKALKKIVKKTPPPV